MTALPEVIYLDTACVIYSVETHAVYWSLLEPFWESAHRREVAFVTSELTLLECLVGALRAGDVRLEQAYEGVLSSGDIRLIPAEISVMREAARQRAAVPSLRTPDAIHAATALRENVNHFFTNDRAFRPVPGLPITFLSDLIP